MSGEYAERGEYHKHLDPNWGYYPIYVRKLALVDDIIGQLPPDAKILDAGCGEGVLVEKYRAEKRDIRGCDLSYESDISVPNLAHAASRSAFLFAGNLVRTAAIAKHPGDRPIGEYLDMIEHAGLELVRRVPLKLTFPSLIDRAGKKILGELWNRFIFWDKWNPNWCFLNLLVLRKRAGDQPYK